MVYNKGIGSGTAAPENICEVQHEGNEDLVLLSREETEEYHILTVKLLHLSKRAIPDLLTSTALHCTRERKPDNEEQKKLTRTIWHLE